MTAQQPAIKEPGLWILDVRAGYNSAKQNYLEPDMLGLA